MARNLRFSPLWIGVLLLIGLLVYINWPQQTEQQQRRGGATPVVVETVTQQPFAIVIEALGTAEANESIELTAQNAAIVTAIAFEDGENVG